MIGKLYAPVLLLGVICTLAVSLYCFLDYNPVGGVCAGFIAVLLGFVCALASAMVRQNGPATLKQMGDGAYNNGYNAGVRDAHKDKGMRLRQDR